MLNCVEYEKQIAKLVVFVVIFSGLSCEKRADIVSPQNINIQIKAESK